VSGRETRVHAGRWRAGHSLSFRLRQSRDCSCYVSCRIQAPPHLRLHKRTVFHAAYVTCPWNWRLCGTNHPILDIANGSPVFSGIWRWPSQHRNISFQ